MSKGLEELKELSLKLCENCPYNQPNMDGDICSKCEEKLNVIEKELKALEIIKTLAIFVIFQNIDGLCNLETILDSVSLTKEEYVLLKEVGL